MKTKSSVLTKEERDVLVLAATHPDGQHLNNTEIAQRLGISVNRVKKLLHQACIKLGATNRNEAILFAIRWREIRLNELYTFDELVDFWSSLCPHVLRRVMHFVHEGLQHEYSPNKDEQIIIKDKREDTILTKSEQDVLILVGRGLTNREIANMLYMSISTVSTYLYRACTKLGVRKKADAVMSALRRGEISIGEMYSIDELLEFLAPLEAESIEKMGQLLNIKFGQEPVSTGS
jgi:DNA-binding CsgD family transcriptional regulator